MIAGARAEAEGLALAERIRDAVPSVRIESNCGSGSFKSQLKRADKSGAHLALILGEAKPKDASSVSNPCERKRRRSKSPGTGSPTRSRHGSALTTFLHR